jgi:Restriction endonuclease
MASVNPKIRSIDMLLIEDLFEMGSGYVLDFSDRTFAIFFAEELNIDIDDPAYAVDGRSKAKRLRCFLRSVEMPLVIRTLQALWEYREAARQRRGKSETVPNAEGRFLGLIDKLAVATVSNPSNHQSKPATDRPKYQLLKAELLQIASLAPHARGYAFEAFLKKLFDAFGLSAREPFSLHGEQIDGSFQLEGQTYLIEAKWHAQKIGVAELHTFHGKAEQKAAWTRGLFISDSGFTDEGLVAFGRGKRVICMDGLDIFDCLERELPLNHVLAVKARHMAETGQSFARVRDLFR